jgi:hypothetical protein
MDPESDFAALRQFHRIDKNSVKGTTIKIKKPEFEFHDIMAVINSYPQILRKLGFVLDFDIPLKRKIPVKGTIRLLPGALDLDGNVSEISFPATAYRITSNGFYTDDRPGTIFKGGFVKINTDAFSVVQVDVDGAALKTGNMVENKIQEIGKFYVTKNELSKSRNLEKMELQVVEPPENEGLPFMRSAGIAVVKNGMAEYLVKSISTNYKIKQEFISAPVRTLKLKSSSSSVRRNMTGLKIKEPVTVLYSNDVVQGYRMDIAFEDEPDKWYSLHKRQDEYYWFDEQNNPHLIDGIEHDEGFIQLGVAEDPDNPDDVFASETLARWEGWSLSVRKPGYAINESDDYELKNGETEKRDFVHRSKIEEDKKYAFDPDLEFRINARSKIVPGTLPKLRFGKEYRVRIRTVDMAGNSVLSEALTESPLETVRKNIRYMRYEPLASPVILVGNELRDGEFIERMVIRSNYDCTAEEYENSHPVDGTTFDSFSRRYLLPPKNSQLMAENHGMFEQAFSNDPGAARDIYKLITDHEGYYRRDDKTKEKVYQPSDVEVVYLPDPMAAGVSLFIADGFEDTHTQDFEPRMFGFFTNKEVLPSNTNVKIPDDWYNANKITILLIEGEYGADWNKSERVFTVFMPKGHRTKIRVSTFWRQEDMEKLSAIWEMVKSDNPVNIEEIKAKAVSGQHWMISPSKEIELVHAVQQPVEQPKIIALFPDRDFGKTFIDLNTRFDIHGQSTEKVEFQAKWTEPFDDTISVEIKEKQGRNSIPDIMISYHDDIVTKGTIPKIEQLVAPHNIQLELKPHTEFKPVDEDQFIKDPQPGAGRINNLIKPKIDLYKRIIQKKKQKKLSLIEYVRMDIELNRMSVVHMVRQRIKPLVHDFGDTKHRWVDYKLVALSRYGEYFDKIVKSDPQQKTFRESEWVEKVNILSSARPKLPDVDYVIPLFEWRKTYNSDTYMHYRKGGGLRIYLKRPWYSSGTDEKLAVVLPTDNETNSLTSITFMRGYTNLYTHWGIDPALYSGKPGDFSPNVTDFGMNPHVDKNLEYPGIPDRKAVAVAYPVHFDDEKQMWYCDISISPGNMYFPFVKLALARYQQHSVRKYGKDVCLSPVVMSTMTQLVPDRVSILKFNKAGNNARLTLTIEGVVFNERISGYGNYNFIRISFLDTRLVQPVEGIIDDGTTEKSLSDEGYTIRISQRDIANNRFRITREFNLPSKYKKEPYQVIIEEYERGPKKMQLPPEYKERLEQSEETDRLIYADVFKVNEIVKG